MMYFCLLVLYSIVPSYGDWRVKLDDDFSLNAAVGVPFYLLHSNEELWTSRNYSWYFPDHSCFLKNRNLVKSKVMCSKPGMYYFGIKDPLLEKSTILKYRSIFVRPTYHCFYWKVIVSEISSHHKKLQISVSKYEEDDLNINQKWSSELYEQRREGPLVAILKNDNVTPSTIGPVKYQNNSWIAFINMTGYSLDVEISSKSQGYVLGCFIKSTRIRLNRPKYIQSESILPKFSTSMIASISNQKKIIQDSYDPHVFAYPRDNKLYFSVDGFKLTSTTQGSDPHNVTDMVMTESCIVYIQDEHIHAINKTGEHSDAGKHKRIYSCRSIPPHLKTFCNMFFAVSKADSLDKTDSFAKYDLPLESTNPAKRFTIPSCQGCTILHVEVSIANDVVRLLVRATSKNEQWLVDCNLATDQTTCVTLLHLTKPLNLKEFRFLPADSLETMLFSDENIYKLENGSLVSKYQLKAEDIGMKQILVSGNVMMVLLSSGYALYYQYGSTAFHKIYIGKETVIYAVDGIFYRLEVGGKNTSRFNSEVITTVVELDAATNHLLPSVLDFKISSNTIVYYLDKIDNITVKTELVSVSKKNCSTKILYDVSSGIRVKKVNETVTERNGVKKVVQNHLIKINSSLSSISRRTTVSFVPDNYEGYALPELTPKTLYITVGCPPGRELRANATNKKTTNCVDARNINSSPKEIKCIKVFEVDTYNNNSITITFKLYHGDTFLQYIETMGYEVLRGPSLSDQVSVADAKNSHKLQFMKAGNYVIRFSARQSPSYCPLVYDFEVNVKSTILHILLKWLIIGLELVVIMVLLAMSFVWFQKKTAKEQEEEIQQQKRQSELKYLTTIKQYQDQMCVKPNPVLAGVIRRRQSSIRRRSVVSVGGDDDALDEFRSSVTSQSSGGGRRRSSIVDRWSLQPLIEVEQSAMPSLNEDEDEDED